MVLWPKTITGKTQLYLTPTHSAKGTTWHHMHPFSCLVHHHSLMHRCWSMYVSVCISWSAISVDHTKSSFAAMSVLMWWKKPRLIGGWNKPVTWYVLSTISRSMNISWPIDLSDIDEVLFDIHFHTFSLPLQHQLCSFFTLPHMVHIFPFLHIDILCTHTSHEHYVGWG